MVAEKGTATAMAAEGEIPFKFISGEKWDYADLWGEGDVFGTIDYGKNPPQVLPAVMIRAAGVTAAAVNEAAVIRPAAAIRAESNTIYGVDS